MKTRSCSRFVLAGLCLAVALFTSPPLRAQSAAPTPPTPPPEARQFDFWVGDWEVFGPAGQKIGTNKVELVAGGYGLLENWTDMRGGSGKSLNTYKRRTRQWQQYWIGSGGQTVEYKGGMVGDKMVMTADTMDMQGRLILMRGIWTPNADGTVTQVFESSTDQGLTWTVNFNGTYRRAGAATPSTP